MTPGVLPTVSQQQTIQYDRMLFPVIVPIFSLAPPPLRVRAAFRLEADGSPLPLTWDEPEIVQSFLRSYAATCLKPGIISTGQELQSFSQTRDSEGGDTEGMEAERESNGITSGGIHDVGTLPTHDRLLPLDAHLAMSRSAFFGRMKKIMRYLFSGEPELWQASEAILRAQPGER